jgi:LacI family transcriptional regulator, gluconate utilization system Gnt-I transcriptional repressor
MPSAALPARSVTLHDVAREAGVSLITASRALGNPDVVSHATIQKVHAAVEATGYVPNLMAGGLKSKRSMTVAALVPVISVPQFLPTVQALTEELDHAGYQLILGQTGYDRGRERALSAGAWMAWSSSGCSNPRPPWDGCVGSASRSSKPGT